MEIEYSALMKWMFVAGINFFTGVWFGIHLMEKAAIRAGFAQYDPLTGKWCWSYGVVVATEPKKEIIDGK